MTDSDSADKITIQREDLERVEIRDSTEAVVKISNSTVNPGSQSDIVMPGKANESKMEKPPSLLWAAVAIGTTVVILAGIIFWHISEPEAIAVTNTQKCPSPCIRVQIIDSSETPLLTEAELYLTAECSSAYEGLKVLIPLNVGKRAGEREIFVKLPFIVRAGDSVVFNLLDEDKLSEAQVKSLTTAAEATGYVIWMGAKIYAAKNDFKLPVHNPEPIVKAMRFLSEIAINEIAEHPFDNKGIAEYVVPNTFPTHPKDVNWICLEDNTIIGKNRVVNARLKVFFQ